MIITQLARICVPSLLLAACQLGEQQDPPTSSVEDLPPLVEPWTKGAMVAAADPRAVEAGLSVLERGGHAVDAAIAVHTVLGLVEPQSSGIGGGAIMVVYERETNQTTVYDGRETAPAAIDENLFVEDGEVIGFIDAWQSGKASGVPGSIALYKSAHDKHGKLAWAEPFKPAIQLAAEGFVVSPRLAGMLSNDRLRRFIRLDDDPVSAAYFYPGGEPLEEGDLRKNSDYAKILQRVSEEGPGAFYSGVVAEAIVSALSQEPRPGNLTVADIEAYRVKERRPLCGDWREYFICSAPPPSSGGVTQNAIAGLYDRLMESKALSEKNRLVSFVDAQRLAYADRDHYLADADFVEVPYQELIDPKYLDARALEVAERRETPLPGDPGRVLNGKSIVDMWGQDPTEHAPGTTHFSIVDSRGNAVAMTATVEAPFGNSRMVHGFLLNNQLTDFARKPRKSNRLVANAPGPGKRPRTSMSPTLVFDSDGDLKLVTGSPGGNSIIAYTAKSILGILAWGLTPQEAVDYPNIIARGEHVAVEVDRPGGQQIANLLRELEYKVQERQGENSGLHVILVSESGLVGAADPRREGIAMPLSD